MESRAIKLLEFPKVLEHLSRESVSVPGQQACLEIRPHTELRMLGEEQQLLQEAVDVLAKYSLKPGFFPELATMYAILDRDEDILDQESLWALQSFLDSAHSLRSSLQEIPPAFYPGLRYTWKGIAWPETLWSALARCLGPAGEIRDQSSPELMAVRQEIRALREQCAKKVNESLSRISLSHYLQDDYLTISSDRYVLALKANFKGRLQGIIHDYSQTGETCYFEPLFLMDMNNRLQGLQRIQKEEERKVRAYLTGLTRRSREVLHALYAWMVRMDVLWAKAGLARKLEGTVLQISSDNRLELKNVRHPLLVLGDHTVVPVGISLNPGQQGLVISGGNAGGKTVCLKSLGLAALMALCALPVPVDEGSSMPFWDKIFVSMVSEQRVEESLSTFTAQIEHFSRFWPGIDRSTLVILDEFGVGTDPSQGAALAQAVVDCVLEKQAWVATATHFPALKAYALSREDVRACSVLFDPQTKKPLYRLAYDQVGASLALRVAREQGLPGEIIDRAREYLLLEDEEQDRLFDRLNRLAAQREEELAELRKERSRLEQIMEKERQKLVLEKTRLIRELKEHAQEIVRQWQTRKAGRRQALKELAGLRRKAESLVEEPVGSSRAKGLTFNDVRLQKTYFYPGWSKSGIVRDKDQRKKLVKIDFGGVSLWVSPGELATSRGVKESEAAGGHTASSVSSQPYRLDLRGRYQDEAMEELEKYLDRAILSGRKQVEIIHGKGTGVLKRAVREYLQKHRMIKNYAPGSGENADDGVTTVRLQ